MSKFAMTAALALITAAIAPVAYAQNSARPTNVALTTQAGQLRASQLIGSTVCDEQNRDIGSVNDVILGRVAAVVLDVGAFLALGGRYVAVQQAAPYNLEPSSTNR